MKRNCAASGEVAILQLDPAEVLALHSFLALGAHFAAIISGEHSPFSPDEVRSLVATVGASPSNTLMDKLAEAVAAVCAIENGYQSRLRGTDGERADPKPVAQRLRARDHLGRLK
jgi:hypothetical protein